MNGDLHTLDIVLRLGAAAAAGMLIGLNRDMADKPIGMRTLGLVALGAALASLAVIEVKDLADHPDALSRVVQGAIQGIMAGISFIGAGVILRDRGSEDRRGPDHGRDRLGDGRARHRLRARRLGHCRRRACAVARAAARGRMARAHHAEHADRSHEAQAMAF